LSIASSTCWILDFKRWVVSGGETFPVSAGLFYSRFFQFSAHREQFGDSSNVEGGGASGGLGYDFYWLDETGMILGTFANFKVTSPSGGRETKEFMNRWSMYVTNRNSLARGSGGVAWIASPLFASAQTTEIVRDSCYLSAASMVAIACLMTFITTCSIGITVAMLTTLLISLCTFGVFWTGVGNRDIGSMEIVSLSVFLCGLAPPLLRVASYYSYARDRPYYPADMFTLDEESGGPAASKNMTPEELEELAKQHAEDMGEGMILMYPGAINNERQQRVATALQRGGAPALGLSGAAVLGGLALLPLEMEALKDVGLAMLCIGFAAVPAMGLLALLLLLGLGDSKARSKAFHELGKYFWSRLSGQIGKEGRGLLDGRREDKGKAGLRKSRSGDDLEFHDRSTSGPGSMISMAVQARLGPQIEPQVPQHKPHTVAAMMLGAPVSLATGNTQEMLRPFGKLKKKKADQDNKQLDMPDDTGDEAGPYIQTLDVQGATAKPPYHIVMATKDVINVKG
jgi:hypothetical protein